MLSLWRGQDTDLTHHAVKQSDLSSIRQVLCFCPDRPGGGDFLGSALPRVPLIYYCRDKSCCR